MELTGKQVQELQEALLSAFPSYSSLEQMVFFKLDENLRHISSKTGLSVVVFELIRWANSHGKVEELVRGAREQNPGNKKLKIFADNYLATPPKRPIPADIPLQSSNYMLSFRERAELVECLLVIPSMADRGTLETVMEQLPAEIKLNVRHSSKHKGYVINILTTCLQYSGGIETLRDILNYFEGESIPMQRFNATLNRLLPRG